MGKPNIRPPTESTITKTKVMTNTEDILEITVTGGQLEQVDSFVNLRSNIKNNTDLLR